MAGLGDVFVIPLLGQPNHWRADGASLEISQESNELSGWAVDIKQEHIEF
jgi:hypothetical protein